MNLTAWANAHPILGHAVATLFIGAWGTLVALFAGTSAPWAVAIGILCAFFWIFSQEQTDERVHRMLIRKGSWSIGPHTIVIEVKDWWHGWDWKDFWGGILGGIVGSVITVVVWLML